MKKVLLALFAYLSFVGGSQAATYLQIYNPFTGRPDYVVNVGSTSVGALIDVSTNGVVINEVLTWDGTQFSPSTPTASGAGTAIAFTTGNLSGYTQALVSTGPFLVIFNQNQFKLYRNLPAGASVQAQIDVDSITAHGSGVNGANNLLLLDGGGRVLDINIPAFIVHSTDAFHTSPSTGIINGTLPVGVVASSLTATPILPGTYGTATQVASFTVLSDGRIYQATNTAILISTTGMNASGTASATTFLRGDNTWSSPAGSGDVVAANNNIFTGSNTAKGSWTETSSFTVTGATINLSGAIALLIPSGSAPTMTVTGNLGVDISSGQLVGFDGTSAVVYPSTFSKSMTLETPAVGDYPFFWRPHTATTVTSMVCISSSATSATIQVDECDANGVGCVAINTAIACTTSATQMAVTNSALDAGDIIRTKVTAISGTTGWVSVTMYAVETRQ